MLLYERKKTDPFVLILVVFSLAFYMLRILTLLNDPWSVALVSHSMTSADVNYSLIFIMLSNGSIFLGLSMAGGRIYFKKELLNEYPAAVVNVMFILLLALALGLYMKLAINILGRFVGYITGSFIKLQLIQMFTAIYLIVNFKKLKT